MWTPYTVGGMKSYITYLEEQNRKQSSEIKALRAFNDIVKKINSQLADDLRSYKNYFPNEDPKDAYKWKKRALKNAVLKAAYRDRLETLRKEYKDLKEEMDNAVVVASSNLLKEVFHEGRNSTQSFEEWLNTEAEELPAHKLEEATPKHSWASQSTQYKIKDLRNLCNFEVEFDESTNYASWGFSRSNEDWEARYIEEKNFDSQDEMYEWLLEAVNHCWTEFGPQASNE